MSFEFATAAVDLEARLRSTIHPATIPDRAIRNADLAARTNALGVTLTYEQLDVSAEYDGQRLAPGHVAIDFQLVLSAPEEDPVKGSARVFATLPALCRALDDMDDIVWTTAAKGRDNAGTFYSIPITIFASYTEE